MKNTLLNNLPISKVLYLVKSAPVPVSVHQEQSESKAEPGGNKYLKNI